MPALGHTALSTYDFLDAGLQSTIGNSLPKKVAQKTAKIRLYFFRVKDFKMAAMGCEFNWSAHRTKFDSGVTGSFVVSCL